MPLFLVLFLFVRVQYRVCLPHGPKGGSNTLLRVRGWGSQFGRLDRKPVQFTLWEVCCVGSITAYVLCTLQLIVSQNKICRKYEYKDADLSFAPLGFSSNNEEGIKPNHYKVPVLVLLGNLNLPWI